MRKKRIYKKYYKPDSKYGSVAVGRFINYLMKDGKKSIAEKAVYSAFEQIHQQTKEDPSVIFDKAITNVSPLVEVVSQRVGGANYQIPREVRPDRQFVLAARWIIEVTRSKKGMPLSKKIAQELIAASNNEGEAMKKKQNTHRMAEANRAFAHFARRN